MYSVLVQGVSKKPAPKSFSHYFLSYRCKSMKLKKYLNNCKQHTKISKTSHYSFRIYRTCPKWPSFEPIHFFKHMANFDNYAFANRLRTSLDFFANANLYLRNVLGFVGKHPFLQITPGEESWRLKSGLWGTYSNFWFFSAIFSAISFLSALLALVLSVYNMYICSNTLQSLFYQLTCSNSKILLQRRSDRFGLRSTDSCTISTICCVRVLGRPEWLKWSEDFLLRLTAVPYVLLTQSWMTDLWSSLSISKNVWNCSEIFLT